MKRILGLDLGPNSIGFATVIIDGENSHIELANSRIIPMDAAKLSDFEKGAPQSQTHDRTMWRGIRRLFEREKLRRERALLILNHLGWLPEHFAKGIDFSGKGAKLDYDTEPKIAWQPCADNKYEFFYQEAFQEMLHDLRSTNPAAFPLDKKVPYDWTIYYLRKKALTRKASKYELAWIILNFNQKRGYNELRGELDNDSSKQEEYYALKVINVEAAEKGKGNNVWYNLTLENGWVYKRQSAIPLFDWKDTIREFIVSTDLDKDGTPKLDKEGNVKRSFRAPKDDDWALKKKRTESEIQKSGKTVGAYIYDALANNPSQKIKGKLVSVVERKFYRQELLQILQKQAEFHPELTDKRVYEECVRILYKSNEQYRQSIAGKDLIYLFTENILFYQRPLKSKKSLIADCPLEHYSFIKDGKEISAPIKCIAKSNPLFQEFRLWQFVDNLKIIKREGKINGKLSLNIDVTPEYIPDGNKKAELFELLNDKKEIDQKGFLRLLKLNDKEYRWNYVEDKKYPCNETRGQLLPLLGKAGIGNSFLTKTAEMELWHILYSNETKEDSIKALSSYARKNALPEQFVEIFSNAKPFKKDYGSFSKKAIKRLLPLMRSGKYWDEKAIDKKTRERIEKIINGEADDSISGRTREQAVKANLRSIDDFSSLPMYLASYVVYDRHSENGDATKWHTPDDIDRFLKQFKQHSLRNPIVEQVILEALRTVRDIWRKTGDFDEIHVELGRDMKNTAEKRKNIMQKALENENTNLRIKALLTEFLNPDCGIENVRPQSPSQQEKLRIYEECVLSEEAGNIPDDIAAIIRNFNESDIKKRPSHSDVIRYKCWLEQKYRSPYTGRIIPLGKLFTSEYEIEHIIPQALYFDDSLSNKVICETAVNKDKGKRLAYNYIKECGGKIISLGENRNAEILKLDKYEELVKNGYPENKKKKLLATEIPDTFSERQLNDTRYISRFVMQLLSNIVRTTDENGTYEQESTSKNVIPCSGKITDMLKRQWGINDVWNRIIAPRFQRLNELHGDSSFGEWCNEEGKRFFRINVPFHLKRGFSTKRIDHRHHAMDAIIIACANRNIINYLNNVEAKSENKRIDLRNLICHKETDSDGNYKFVINKPWATFTEDVQSTINKMTVSFKNNIRIINRTKNRYQKFVNGEKQFVEQEKGDQWAIRKPLHKDSYYGLINVRKEKDVNLPIAVAKPEMIIDKQLKSVIKSLKAEGKDDKRIISILKNTYGDKVKKVRIYYFTNDSNEKLVAIRKPLDASFDRKKITTSVSDAGVRKILLNHLAANSDNPQIAFSPEGIEKMNENIIRLNGGKPHKPIYKTRVSGTLGKKFNVGTKGYKKAKFVETAKDTNLYFAIYKTPSGKRTYQTIPLNEVIERLKRGWTPIPEQDENGNSLLFSISPNDLVYVPTPDELESGIISEPIDNSRIYKMVSANNNRCAFIPATVATPIEDKVEFRSDNKIENLPTGESIKSICLPIKIDRLGNISLLTNKTL